MIYIEAALHTFDTVRHLQEKLNYKDIQLYNIQTGETLIKDFHNKKAPHKWDTWEEGEMLNNHFNIDSNFEIKLLRNDYKTGFKKNDIVMLYTYGIKQQICTRGFLPGLRVETWHTSSITFLNSELEKLIYITLFKIVLVTEFENYFICELTPLPRI